MEWDWFSSRLQAPLSWLCREVELANQGALPCRGQTSTEYFPFREYLTFSRDGDPAEEDLVVDVSVWRDDDSLRVSSDISSGDGLILAEGPEADLLLNQSDAWASLLEDWLVHFDDFIRSHRGTVVTHLMPK